MLSMSLRSFFFWWFFNLFENLRRFQDFPTIRFEIVRTTEEWIVFDALVSTKVREILDSRDFRIFLYNFIGALIIIPVLIHTNSKKNPTYDENSTLHTTLCARTFLPELALFCLLSCFTRPNHDTGIHSWNSLYVVSIFLLLFFPTLLFYYFNFDFTRKISPRICKYYNWKSRKNSHTIASLAQTLCCCTMNFKSRQSPNECEQLREEKKMWWKLCKSLTNFWDSS